ncbi:MAG: amidohydrolase [Propionibacteriales bacterium]|nr:amidohydrolase [Propionibacteriales bacterium]
MTAEPLERVSRLDEIPLQALRALAAAYADELVALRRDLHTHPELSWFEERTTAVLRERLLEARLRPEVLPGGTGLVCDVGEGDLAVALRADIDALPLADRKSVPYASTVENVCHACGHDVHTAVVLGAGLVLADLDREGRLPGRVRLVFQPAEESARSGARSVVEAGGMNGVSRIFAMHCDPRLPVGRVGLREGAITTSADHVRVQLSGRGGHTARPHLTGDLVFALGKVITELPAALSRRVDPRAALSVVWGHVDAGRAANAIPESGVVEGTVRCLDREAWDAAPELVGALVQAIVAPYDVRAELNYDRNVPPVENEPTSIELLRCAAVATEGPDSVASTERSLGGEDFSWYLSQVPGALARLGVRPAHAETDVDLHQGLFDVDERAISVGARVLVAAALLTVG